MKWKDKVIHECTRLVEDGEIEKSVLNKIQEGTCGIHVAVFVEPFMSLIIQGQKTIESRFSINKIAPFAKIAVGDIVFIKRSGGEIEGYFEVQQVSFFSNLKPSKHAGLEALYGHQICTQVDPDFWDDRRQSRFLTLIEITSLKQIKGFASEKRDRLSWIVLRQHLNNELFSK